MIYYKPLGERELYKRMMNVKQEEFLNRLKRAWISTPHLRFGQFIFNAFPDLDILYNMTNEEIIKEVEAYVAGIKNNGLL